MGVYHSKMVTVVVETGTLIYMKASAREKAMKVLDKAAFDIEAAAKSMAPVDTGALRSSIYVSGASGGSNYGARVAEASGKAATRGKKVKFTGEIGPRNTLERVIAPSVNYAIFPELSGQPYLEPAVEACRDAFVQAWYSVVSP